MIAFRSLCLSAVIALVSSSGTAFAQWTSDPLSSAIVANGTGDQGVPLTRAAADGGVWVSLMDNGAGTGYKPTIQRLTRIGLRMFPGNGIVLANRTNTATFVYDLKVDASNNAIVAFDDNSSGTTVITVQKVAPDGSLPWGATGIQMPNTNNVLSPRVAACADGTYVVAWSASNILNFRRVNADGTLGATWTVSETSKYHAISDLQAGTSGNDVIALYVRGESSAISSRKGLRMQKFDSTNTAQWNGGLPLEIYTSQATPSKSIQNGYFPAMVPDGSGGVVVAWYDTGAARNAWLQHVNANGTQRFVAQGLAVSNINSGELRLSASVGYDATANAYTVGYMRSNTGQSQWGLSAQRIDSDGNLLWNGGQGTAIIPMGGFQSSFINSFIVSNGNSYLTWMQFTSATNLEIQAAALDTTGTPIWSPSVLGVATQATPKGRLSAARSIGNDMLIGAWADGNSGDADILATNINFDGTLGMNLCRADFNNDGAVDFFDYDDFVTCFEGGGCPLGRTADFNNDGAVDFFDYDDFVLAFESPC